MVWLLLTMTATLLLATAVTLFVAFPRRGVEVPVAPELGRALDRSVRRLPTLSRR